MELNHELKVQTEHNRSIKHKIEQKDNIIQKQKEEYKMNQIKNVK